MLQHFSSYNIYIRALILLFAHFLHDLRLFYYHSLDPFIRSTYIFLLEQAIENANTICRDI